MTGKTSTHTSLPPIEWKPEPFKRIQEEPEVVELFGDEAMAAWARALAWLDLREAA